MRRDDNGDTTVNDRPAGLSDPRTASASMAFQKEEHSFSAPVAWLAFFFQ